jgi:hypothetical protein
MKPKGTHSITEVRLLIAVPNSTTNALALVVDAISEADCLLLEYAAQPMQVVAAQQQPTQQQPTQQQPTQQASTKRKRGVRVLVPTANSMQRWTLEDVEKVLAMSAAGVSLSTIAKRFGRSEKAIYHCIRIWGS